MTFARTKAALPAATARGIMLKVAALTIGGTRSVRSVITSSGNAKALEARRVHAAPRGLATWRLAQPAQGGWLVTARLSAWKREATTTLPRPRLSLRLFVGQGQSDEARRQ